MRALTHYLFSAGLALYLLSYVHEMGLVEVLLAVWLSFAVNALIDGLGHRSKNGRPARTWITHSVVTAPFWGALAGVGTILAVNYLGAGTAGQTVFWAGLGCLIAFGHLFLDSLTEGGVFWLTRRVALAHFKYNNPVLNGTFALLGLVLVATALA